jgi:1-acyl-sn-glycerol-3-phosphate acyltransferase
MKNFVFFLLKVYFGIFYRVSLVNMQNVPKKGGAILCANHIGQMDMFFIGYKLKRLVHYMAKEELFKVPLLGAFIRYFGAFPVRRGTGDISAIKTALKLLEEGNIVGILPEGTRTKGKNMNDIKPKPGIVMIAIKAGVPIIPVAIEGDYKLFGKVKVIYGKPFVLDVEKNKKYSSEELAQLSLNIMKRVYSLLEDK